MAKINKKVINLWDGGIKTSARSSDPNTSDGVQMIKGFDVYKDPKKLIPMQSWEDFNLESEMPYNIRAMGGQSDIVYGMGKGLSNWLGSAWQYRIKVDANPSLHVGGLPLWFDMSKLPTHFWDNVQSGLTDVRASSNGGSVIPMYMENIDEVNKTGDMWLRASDVANSFYIYYGNSSITSQIPYGEPDFDYQNSQRSVWQGIRFAYTFGDDDVSNRHYALTGVDGEEAFTTNPTFNDGLFGKAITNSNIQTENDTPYVYLSGGDITVSFLIKPTSFTTEEFIKSNGNFWTIGINSSGKILFYVSGASGSATKTSTASILLNQWNVVDCVYDGNYYIYINGLKETFADNNGNIDYSENDMLILNPYPTKKIAQVWGLNYYISQADSTGKYNNFTNASFWTVNTYEDKSSVNLEYGGACMWQKSITSGNWTEKIESGQPIKTLSYFPTNSWIDDNGDYTLVQSVEYPETNGFYDLAKLDYSFDWNFLSNVGYVGSSLGSKVCLNSVEPLNNVLLYNYGTSSLGSLSDESVYSAGGVILSTSPWRDYLAVAYTRRNRGFIEITPTTTSGVSTTPIEKIDIGTGNVRIVGTAGDILFTVVDNFIDDAVKSANKPTMEIRQYAGNGQTVKTHVIEVPAVITGYTDNWERAVSSFKIKRNTQTLFYARLPKDETGTTFNEGLWAIGTNRNGELSLTLQIDTEGLGMPEQLFSFAQQVFFIMKNGQIKRLSNNTYSNTALTTTLKMNEGNTNIEKKLIGVEVITEPLETNQIISVYYKRDGDATRTLIGTMSGEGEISKEFLYDNDAESLKNYREIEFDIESTGGKSAVLELNYKYEYTKDIV